MAKLLWTLKQHIGPQARVGHAMAYDDHSGGALLFGGQFFSSARLADTWQWDGQNWTQMNDVGPPARSESAMAYDSQRKRTVLFGGANGSTLFGDTWEWDGEDWTELATDGPTRRSQHSLIYDSSRHVILLFGGTAVGSRASDDTWVWDGDGWVQVEGASPPKRYSAAMAFDVNRGCAVLFGGTNGKTVFGDTWEWDGSSWSEMSTIGPPASFAGTMIYTGNNVRLYGGMSSKSSTATLSGNSWEWDGKHWTVHQDMGPGGRWGHAMAFDSNRNRGVFFGGCALPPGPSKSKALGDTWEQFEEGVAVNPASTPSKSTSSSQSITSTQPTSTAPTSATPAQVDPSAVSSAPAPQNVYYDPTITSVTVSPAVVKEGTPVSVYYRVSPPPSFDPNVVLIHVSKLVRLSVSRAANNGSFKLLDFQHQWDFQPPYPLVLPEGYYSISGELGGTTATTMLTVQSASGLTPPSIAPLPSLYSGSPPSFYLSIGPPTVAKGARFNLSVDLGSPVFTDTYIPLIVTVWPATTVQWSGLVFTISFTADGDPDMVWFGQPYSMQLKIPAGAHTGQVQIYAPSIAGTYSWRATLSGRFSNAVDLQVT